MAALSQQRSSVVAPPGRAPMRLWVRLCFGAAVREAKGPAPAGQAARQEIAPVGRNADMGIITEFCGASNGTRELKEGHRVSQQPGERAIQGCPCGIPPGARAGRL